MAELTNKRFDLVGGWQDPNQLPTPERLTFLPHPYGMLKSEGRGSVMGPGIQWNNWIAPQILTEAMRAFTAPSRAWKGELDPSSPEAIQEALNVGGMAMAPGLGKVVGGARVPAGQFGANVFHGSPHKFDAFDASKIGTGEGAQAYGHGCCGQRGLLWVY